jgi:hypothetical protein
MAVVDDVTAETLGHTTTVTRWNEVEVELVEGDPTCWRQRTNSCGEPVWSVRCERPSWNARWPTVCRTRLVSVQDAVLAGRTLRDMGMRAHVAGENAFTYGVLYERNAATVPHQQAKAEHFWKKH